MMNSDDENKEKIEEPEMGSPDVDLSDFKYQSPEEEPKAPHPGQELLSHMMSSKLVRRVFLPLYLIIIIIFVYKFIGWYSAKKQPVEQQEKIVQKVQPEAPKVPISVVEPVKPQPQYVQSLSVIEAEDSISKVDRLTLLMEKSDEGQSQIIKMRDSLDHQTEILEDVGKSVKDLTVSVNSLSKKMNKLFKKPKPKKKVIKKHISYHIIAMVPGRAWLEDNYGRVRTVRIGDVINNGKVELISTERNIIVTSRGEIIQYGGNDF